MSVVVFANATSEVATTTIAAAQPEGLCLQYNATGLLAPATTRIDGILQSEVVTDAEYLNRYSIYQQIDFGPYTKIGEPSSVIKGFRGASALGLLVSAASAIPAGTELELNAGVLRAKASGTAVAVAVDAIAAGATRTGKIHIY